jgi:glycosyltransferase involved in cell wall biosynthesis
VVRKAYSKVNLLKDNSGWVTALENKALSNILKELDIGVISKKFSISQICYFPDKYAAIKLCKLYSILGNRLAFDYYHGDPSITPSFSKILSELKAKKKSFQRIRISHSGIEQLLINEGFENEIFRIPIGIDINLFPVQTLKMKAQFRTHLNIPQDAFVIGSFQKDGNGWAEGNEPKFIKGPDIFLKTLKILKFRIPELFILLTGPARGYVKSGLEVLGIPYLHFYPKKYDEISMYYQTLDAYLVSSREEGGPKAILESMASGIPIVSTRVGQAQDLIINGINGWLSDSEDYESLANNLLSIFYSNSSAFSIKHEAREVAEKNTYYSQNSMWNEFFQPLLK